jgi:acyl carrier protein
MIAEEHLLAQLREPTQTRIVGWLSDYVSDLLALDAGDIDMDRSFSRYGLDSSAAVGMTGDLGNWLKLDIDPAVVYDYPCIARLAEHLSADPQVQARLSELA